MSKKPTKLYLTFSEEVYDQLSQWAEVERRPLTNLGVWIIERALQQAIEDGVITPPPPQKSHPDSDNTALVRLIELITEGGDLSTEAIAQAALAANVDPVELTLKLEKLKNGNGETSRT